MEVKHFCSFDTIPMVSFWCSVEYSVQPEVYICVTLTHTHTHKLARSFFYITSCKFILLMSFQRRLVTDLGYFCGIHILLSQLGKQRVTVMVTFFPFPPTLIADRLFLSLSSMAKVQGKKQEEDIHLF